MDWLSAVPVLGKLIDFITWAGKNIGLGVRLLSWKISMWKLLKKKEKINDAETPGDYMDLTKR